MRRRCSGRQQPVVAGPAARRVLLAACVQLAVMSACHDADRYVLTGEDSIGVQSLFALTVDGDTTLAADGLSKTILVAQVKDVTESGRSVLFVTNAGLLRVGNTFGDSAVVQTDADGRARVELLSSREMVTARVIATVMDVRPPLVQEVSIPFRAVELDSVLHFVDAPDSAIAAPSEWLDLTVWISPAIEGEDRQVTFEASAGSFEFASGEGRMRTVRAGDDGLATARLSAPAESAQVTIRATVKGFTQEAGIRFTAPPAIRFVEAPTSTPADGETVSPITVAVSAGGDDAEVVFETTAGVFTITGRPSASVLVAADDRATVHLRSPTRVTLAVVTVAQGDLKEEQPIQFEAALPDSVVLTVEGAVFRVGPADQVQLLADFRRAPGRGVVSEGLGASFRAADSLGNAVDRVRFLNVTTIEAGQASAVFTPDSTSYRGLLTITASATDFPFAGRGEATLRITD